MAGGRPATLNKKSEDKNMEKNVQTVEKTDFELGQINALNRIISAMQKFTEEINQTNFGQLNAMSLTDDFVFMKLRERVSCYKHVIEQLNEIKESI